MGIKGLMELLAAKAPKSKSIRTLGSYNGRIIAVDTNMYIHQFLKNKADLRNRSGEETTHINGLLLRTIKFLEAGIKPVFVFDGAPPAEKKEYTSRQRKLKRKAEEEELRAHTGTGADNITHMKKQRAMQSQETIRKLPSVGHKDGARLPSIGHKDGARLPSIKHEDLHQDADANEDERTKALKRRLNMYIAAVPPARRCTKSRGH